MDSGREAFPNDIEELKAALVAARDARIVEAARAAYAEAELAVARAKASDDQALIAHQQLRIEKLTRQLYGPRSERTSRLLDQIELQFEELESSATEDEIAAEMAVAKTTTVVAFTASAPRASRSPSICRASGLSCRDRPLAFAAAAGGCANWVRVSPRRWNQSHANGR